MAQKTVQVNGEWYVMDENGRIVGKMSTAPIGPLPPYKSATPGAGFGLGVGQQPGNVPTVPLRPTAPEKAKAEVAAKKATVKANVKKGVSKSKPVVKVVGEAKEPGMPSDPLAGYKQVPVEAINDTRAKVTPAKVSAQEPPKAPEDPIKRLYSEKPLPEKSEEEIQAMPDNYRTRYREHDLDWVPPKTPEPQTPQVAQEPVSGWIPQEKTNQTTTATEKKVLTPEDKTRLEMAVGNKDPYERYQDYRKKTREMEEEDLQAGEEMGATRKKLLSSYMKGLDDVDKRKFIDAIAENVGKIASGVAGGITGTPVGKYYQYTPMDVAGERKVQADAYGAARESVEIGEKERQAANKRRLDAASQEFEQSSQLSKQDFDMARILADIQATLERNGSTESLGSMSMEKFNQEMDKMNREERLRLAALLNALEVAKIGGEAHVKGSENYAKQKQSVGEEVKTQVDWSGVRNEMPKLLQFGGIPGSRANLYNKSTIGNAIQRDTDPTRVIGLIKNVIQENSARVPANSVTAQSAITMMQAVEALEGRPDWKELATEFMQFPGNSKLVRDVMAQEVGSSSILPHSITQSDKTTTDTKVPVPVPAPKPVHPSGLSDSQVIRLQKLADDPNQPESVRAKAKDALQKGK